MSDLQGFNTLEGWFNANLKNQSNDITNHGCVNGFDGLTYYSETVEKYNRYEAEIWESIIQDAEEQGMTCLQLIASFNGSKDVVTNDAFKNLLVWHYIEKLAFDIVNQGG